MHYKYFILLNHETLDNRKLMSILYKIYKYFSLFIKWKAVLVYKYYYIDFFKYTLISISRNKIIRKIIYYREINEKRKLKNYWSASHIENNLIDEIILLNYFKLKVYKPQSILREALYRKNFLLKKLDELIIDKGIDEINNNSNVLDLACGSGTFLFDLYKKNKFKNCTGIDNNKDALNFAEKFYFKNNDHFVFLLKNLNDSEFLLNYKNKFSHIFCVSFLTYIDEISLNLLFERMIMIGKNIIIYERSSNNKIKKDYNADALLKKILLNFGFKKYTTKIGLTKDESLYYLKVTNKI